MAQTIAAISTPLAQGGIAVIRLSGDRAISIADRVFFSKSGMPLSEKKGYTAAYGRLVWKGRELDESVATVFRAPRSYTGEDVVELSCHGGVFLAREVLRALLDQGAVLAQPGEFTKRAFLNGKLSLTQAEAVADMISAKSTQALKAARSQLGGALHRKLEEIQEMLVEQAAHLAAWADYPEEDISDLSLEELLSTLEKACREMDRLLATFDRGKLIREGIDTVIAGKPNVGKSTLMNLLSGCNRSIVTDVAGTTRDVVEETVQLGDILLRLSDTAGIRETQDQVEQIGVQIARERLDNAQLVLAVFDSSLPLSAEDETLMAALEGKPVLAIINKTDLTNKIQLDVIKKHFPNPLFLSARQEESLQTLEQAIRETVHLHELDTAAGILATERQRECARRARGGLADALGAVRGGMTLDAVTVSLDEAIGALLELSGKQASEEVVGRVFSRFCVGK